MLNYPQIFRVRQHFPSRQVADVPAEVEAQLAQRQLAQRVRPGQTVAITAGSRGVANIHLILRAAVAHLTRLGARPFIVPAMGSHAGGTAQGQRALVESYGITEEFVGCPIRSSMETVLVCRTHEGFPVHFDRCAFEADHVLVVNRIKPHTRFAGDIESGLMKMLLIGLGKCEGARVYHTGHPGLQLRPDHSQRGRRGLPSLPHSGRPGDCGECLRPDGAYRGRRRRSVRGPREGPAGPGQTVDAAAAV